jgi:hypothetical protein
MSVTRSRTGTSNEVGDAESPKSIRKVTRPVSATAPPGRRPLVMIHPAKPRVPSSPIRVSAGSGGPTSNVVAQQQDNELGAAGRRILCCQEGDEPKQRWEGERGGLGEVEELRRQHDGDFCEGACWATVLRHEHACGGRRCGSIFLRCR